MKACIRLGVIYMVLLQLCMIKLAAQERIESLQITASPGQSFLLKDDKIKSEHWKYVDRSTLKIYNYIILDLKDDPQVPAGFSAIVTAEIKYWKEPSDHVFSPPGTESGTKTIQLRVDKPAPNGIAKFSDTYTMPEPESGVCFSVSITSVNDAGGNPVASNFLKIRSALFIDRSFNFDPANALRFDGKIFNTSPNDTSQGTSQLQIMVDSYIGAEEYDIEWTLIDEGKGNRWNTASFMFSSNQAVTGTQLPEYELGNLFRNSSTRVSCQEYYTVPLVYNSKYIAVRVRPVQYRNGLRVEGAWQYSIKTQTNGHEDYGIWLLPLHQKNLNWLMSATYAEEGKKKNVVSYFDGALRQRQAVTINNSDQITTVQENIYDAFGRLVVSILPAPVSKDKLNYFPGLNLSASRTDNQGNKLPYSYLDVDNSKCEALPGKVALTSGTGLYYSPDNPFKDQINGSYIPNANGYPFSVTQYVADNTGRVKVQGGVGEQFQPGNGNQHVTKYYYGKPQQWELDRMFGSDAGLADHYKKNIVWDPNGQLSINYLNAAGKTVATALTSTAPLNLENLESATIPADDSPEVKYETLFRPEQFVFNETELSLTAKATYITTIPGQKLKVQYSLEQLISKYNKAGNDFCASCVYDVKIKVTDACGKEIPVQPATTLTIGTEGDKCDVQPPVKIDFEVTGNEVGEHYFSFEFALDKERLEAATRNFVTKAQDGNQISKRIDFILAQIKTADFKADFGDCETCMAKLETDAGFKAAFTAKFRELGVTDTEAKDSRLQSFIQERYDVVKQICIDLRKGCVSNACAVAEQVLLLDVTPGGQYSSFDKNGQPIDILTNILYLHFKKPNGSDPGVFASVGDVNEADQVVLGNGTVIYPSDPDFDLNNLITYWKPHWAKKFLKYHPEYCKLKFCQENSFYSDWDYRIEKLFTFKEIQEEEFKVTFNNNDIQYILNKDPFFEARAPGAAERPAFIGQLSEFTKQFFASAPAKNISAYVNYTLYCSNLTSSGSNLNTSSQSTGDAWKYQCVPDENCRIKEREWNLFKQYYFDLKRKLYNKIADESSSYCGAEGKCKVSTPLALISADNCVSAKDFVLEEIVGVDGGCYSGNKRLRLTYRSGVPQNLTLNLTYPTAYFKTNINGTITFHALPTTVKFIKGQIYKEFCVPAAVTDISTIQISNIKCTPQYSKVALWGTWKKRTKREVTYNADMQVIQDRDIAELNVGPYTYDIGPTINYPYDPQKGQTKGKDFWSIDSSTGEFVIHDVPEERYFIISVDDDQLVLRKKLDQYTDLITTYDRTSACPTCAVVNPFSSNFDDVLLNSYWSMVDYTPSNPPSPTTSTGQPDPCVIFRSKVSRFPQYSAALPANMDGVAYKYEQEYILNNKIKSFCESNADKWMASLNAGIEEKFAGSGNMSQVKINIRQALIDLCIKAGDADHISGATTLPANQQGGLRSFEAILNSYAGASGLSATYNPWLIDFPYPYDVKQLKNTKVISNTSQEVCNNLTALIAQKPASQAETAFLEEKLKLSEAEVLNLKKSCVTCKYLLEKDIILPPILEGINTSCITKSKVDELIGVIAGKISGFSSSSPNYKTILLNYINQSYGTAYAQSTIDRLIAGGVAQLCPEIIFSNIKVEPFSSTKASISTTVNNAINEYRAYIAEEEKAFRKQYIKTCGAAKASADLKVAQGIYHYTLYYYDENGNLVRTIPPEGVKLLTALQTKEVEHGRTAGASDCAEYTTVSNTVVLDESTAFNSLSQTLAASGEAATEFWLYNGSSQNSQTLITTTDNQFLLNACIHEGKLKVDIYSLKEEPGKVGIEVVRSNHIAANIQRLMPLSSWTHLVVKSSNGMASGDLKLFLNGNELSGSDLITGLSAAGCGWAISGTVSKMDLPENIADLKHIRTYQRPLELGEIQANAANTCFMPTGTATVWARFNVPAPGSITTSGPGSTIERSAGALYPAHTMATIYEYNSLNQVSRQSTPDGGENQFWYDRKGRLVASQNAKQKTEGKYSYTRYDALGRIKEVGEKTPSRALSTQNSFLAENEDFVFLSDNEAADKQITRTYYDAAPPANEPGIQGSIAPEQNNLAKRVSATVYRAERNSAAASGSYYSYDMAGNVEKLWQYIPELGLKRIDYQYDLVSGKVNFVAYQNISGAADKFFYQYKYDAENRLIDVYNGTEGTLKAEGGSYITNGRLLAKYYYYAHGPLARVELGDELQKVQALDYAYTLQGWIKGVNGEKISSAMADPQGNSIPKDVMAYSLGYYAGDYTPIGGTSANAFNSRIAPSNNETIGQSLYNGNISQMMVSVNKFSDVGYAYRYDQLNRLVKMRQFDGNIMLNAYGEDVSYDGNGNIKTFKRKDKDGNMMDDLAYNYKAGNNQLHQVSDAVTTNNIPEDIESGQSANNYRYDAIGNLVADERSNAGEKLTDIKWNLYGKIESITREVNGQPSMINYKYDPSGNRISKEVNGKITYYVRDAQGNTLSLYSQQGGATKWDEQYLYGSSRLGLWKPSEVTSAVPTMLWNDYRGAVNYEMSNHLGNVLAVITDKRPLNSSGVYEADVVSSSDYTPFGMPIVGRAHNNGSYRYGFNGKENDNDVKGVGGSQQDYGMRIYDPRLGRFLSADPLEKDFPFYSPYQFASNSPIVAIDLDGLEAVVVVTGNTQGKKENARGQYFMYQVKIYENTTLEQYNAQAKAGILGPPTATTLLSRDAWQKPNRAGRSESRYGALNETPPGTYYLEYSAKGYGSKKYNIKLSDKKGGDNIMGPNGEREGVRVHEFSPHDAVGCLTCGSGRDKKPVNGFVESIPSLKKNKEVRIILEEREVIYNKDRKLYEGTDLKIPPILKAPTPDDKYTPAKLGL